MSKRAMLSDSILQYDRPPCGALTHVNGSVTWRLWAPLTPRTELLLYGPESDGQTATVAMQFNMSGKTLDGIHPKPETYAAWTTVLAQYLE